MEDHPILEVRYRGDDDLTVWLERINQPEPPLIVPRPCDDGRVVVCLTWFDGKPFLGVPLELAAIPADWITELNVLWFCNVPFEEFRAQTDFSPDSLPGVTP